MPITITCPDCDSRIRAPDSVAGRPVTCPKCGKHFTAVAGPDVPTAAPPSKVLSVSAPASSPPAPAPAKAATAPVAPTTEPTTAPPAPADGWAEIVQAPAPPPPEKVEPKQAPNPLPEPEPVPEPVRPPNVLLDFLLFRKMIAPALIQILFWFSFVGCVLFGGLLFAQVLALLQQGKGFAPVSGYLFATLAIWFLGPLVARLACEVLILLFRMHDTLKQLKDANDKRAE